MTTIHSADARKLAIRYDVDRLRDERDNIFRSLEASTNTSERRSLQWAWYIKQAQIRARGMDLALSINGLS